METDRHFENAEDGGSHDVDVIDANVPAITGEEGREVMAAETPRNIMEHTQRKRKSSVKILGKEYPLGESMAKRIAIAECGTALFSLSSIFLLTLDTFTKDVPDVALLISFCLALAFLSMVYYSNVSFVIIKRLLREPNVILIFLLSLANLGVDIARPSSPFSWAYALLYILTIVPFIFVDAIQVKHRSFAIFLGFVFLWLNCRNFYENTIGDASYGIAPFKYNINNKEYAIDKRSLKRSIYAQVLMFSIQGLYVMMTDKDMKKMFFGTGAIFRSTGTTSENVMEVRHSIKYHVEMALKRERLTKKNSNILI